MGAKQRQDENGTEGRCLSLDQEPSLLPWWLRRKESALNAGEQGSIPVQEDPLDKGNGNSLHYSCLENPTDRGSWQATVHGVAEPDMTE